MCLAAATRLSYSPARHPNGKTKAAAQATMASKPTRKPTSRQVGRPTKGGLQRHPAPVVASNKSYREESSKCKEAGGAQDDLFDEDDNENKDDGLDDEVNTPSLLPLPQRNVLNNSARYNNVS